MHDILSLKGTWFSAPLQSWYPPFTLQHKSFVGILKGPISRNAHFHQLGFSALSCLILSYQYCSRNNPAQPPANPVFIPCSPLSPDPGGLPLSWLLRKFCPMQPTSLILLCTRSPWFIPQISSHSTVYTSPLWFWLSFLPSLHSHPLLHFFIYNAWSTTAAVHSCISLLLSSSM